MKKLNSIRFTLLFWIIIFFPNPGIINAQQRAEVISEQDNGLLTTTFKTSKGDVTVYLPGDIYAEDVISGTVLCEPKGKNEKQIEKNGNVLNGYVVELEDKKETVEKKKMNWEIPATITGGIVPLVLKDLKGKEIGKAEIPANNSPRHVDIPEIPGEGDYSFPPYSQTGQTGRIPGYYDGLFDNTNLEIDDEAVILLAESPGNLYFETPSNLSGPADIVLREGSVTVQDRMHILDLNMTADKLNLMKGEQATVTLEVRGLLGIEQDVPVRIVNLTPEVILMKGGDEQVEIIHPEAINNVDAWIHTFIVEAIRAGAFSVQSNVEQPSLDK